MANNPSPKRATDNATDPCVPRIGMIYNARSRRNQGRDLRIASRPCLDIAQPTTKPEIADALQRFARDGIDYLIISGGDGTVRDVLTMGHRVFAEDWPALAVLPRGKTNALNADVAAPANWRLEEAIGAFGSARRVVRRPIVVRSQGGEGPPILGFILGAGIFTEGVRSGQEAHRMGLFDSLAVAMTSSWGIVQTVIGGGSSKWRRGTAMRLRRLPGGTALPHAPGGDPGRRSLLLASTLRRMPLGIQLFGKGQEGLRLAVLDRPRRRVMSFVPAMLAGWHPAWLERAGLHHLSVEGFAMEIEDSFVLDGETFPAGSYTVTQGPPLTFLAP